MQTPFSELKKIALVGDTNAGKSLLFNNILSYSHAIVSNIAGTTTDPVTRRIELQDVGICALTDTPGFNDCSELSTNRVERTKDALSVCDAAIFVSSAILPLTESEEKLFFLIKEKKYFFVLHCIKYYPLRYF